MTKINEKKELKSFDKKITGPRKNKAEQIILHV